MESFNPFSIPYFSIPFLCLGLGRIVDFLRILVFCWEISWGKHIRYLRLYFPWVICDIVDVLMVGNGRIGIKLLVVELRLRFGGF